MIRRATKSDLPVMISISQHSFETPWAVASFEAEFYKNYSHIYIYTYKEQPVAYLIVWDLKEEGEVVSLAVDKGWRNRGIAAALLKFAFENHNVKTWHLEVDPKNNSAINLYEKYAFKKSRTIKDYYGQGKDAIQMNRA